MSEIKVQLWKKMQRMEKSYREAFAASHLSANLAAQLYAMRKHRGWLQKDLADKANMKASRISQMEDPSYDQFTLSTLKRLASAFDVALIVRFVPFSELLEYATTISPEQLAVRDFTHDNQTKTL